MLKRGNSNKSQEPGVNASQKVTRMATFRGFAWERQVGKMPFFVVYCNPDDYPGKFVVRLWGLVKAKIKVAGGPGNPSKLIDSYKRKATEYIVVKDTLSDARKALPEGLSCVARGAGDPPVIVETWFK